MDEIKVLGRADFLAAVNNFKRELVPVPDLGGAVYVCELSGGQIIAYNERIQALKLKGKKQVNASTSIELMTLLVSMTVCDADGNLLFTEADVKALARTKLSALLILSAKAMEVSGMSNAAIDEVKANLKKAASVDSASS